MQYDNYTIIDIINIFNGYFNNNVFTQGEIRRLRFRFHNGYSTETRISANGNSSSRCGKHGCTLRFRSCGSAETHSLNSCIRNVYAVTETLIAVMFPQLVNSTDTQLSAGFPDSKFNDNSRIHKVYAVTETLVAVMFPRIVNSTDTQASAGFPERVNLATICNWID